MGLSVLGPHAHQVIVTNYRTTHADIDLIVAQLSDIARQLPR
jgi:hypothetical protein